MDEKNYLDQCMGLSNRIVEEIFNLMVANNELMHDFKHVFSYCGQYEEEASLFDIYFLERSDEIHEVVFSDKPHNNESVQTRTTANNLTAESLARLLQNLKYEYRAKKIIQLRDLIINAGEYVKFNGKKDFLFSDKPQSSEDVVSSFHFLDEVRILGFDNVEFVTSDMNCDVSQIPDETLDQIIDYVKKQTEKIDLLLTDEQLKVMDEFYNAIKKMEEVGIAVIRDAEPDGGFYFVNGKGLEFAGGEGIYDLDNYVCVQDQINEMEMFSYSDLSDWLFCSDYENLYAKHI